MAPTVSFDHYTHGGKPFLEKMAESGAICLCPIIAVSDFDFRRL